MSEVAKKPHIEVKVGSKQPRLYLVPKEKVNGLEKLLKEYLVENQLISSDEVFQEMDKRFSKVGNTLAGLRLRDGLTQVQLAKKVKTSQPTIAAIENGKRSVGKTLAFKLAKVFNTDYKVFL